MTSSLHWRIGRRVWILSALVLLLLAGHGIGLAFVSSHLMPSVAVAGGVLLLMVLKHVGVMGPLFVLFRRWRKGRHG
jgi:membrane protein YdbS with pleckstrin-like domain